ncbi:hypothetical protein [Porphyromonas levii]|uniref:hypothetical protein n=1 Tax=Porphyromonas levii TaxID=28114 RepID=UPI001B8C4549|nr:hypothetical protein [Porphyromonas levii]MBR8714136.1 hypothetical protein [Porphyromonas levii]MBR8716129.1 hypothetical protein [Porphyromonas levii]MBR8728663.1 hypothetical protein [Porphyromonas levii]MBR8736978.1 hypothetical protein [Porphyromonas levii]MBR8774746.1 hypothetical protein [Porphyromonas levii]
MILIISNKKYEQGTDPVVEWLHYYKHPFLKLYAEDISSGHHSLSVDSTTGDVLISGINLTKDVNVVFLEELLLNGIIG